MKWETLLFFGLGILFMGFVFSPVSANPVAVMYMKHNFSKGNVPIHGPINFTMNCYGPSFNGSQNVSGICDTSIPSGRTQLLYSDSTTCIPGENSIRGRNCDKLYDYRIFRNEVSGKNFSSCDVEGVYSEKSFVIRNFTNNPDSFCVHYGQDLYTRDYLGGKVYYVLSSRDADYCFSQYSKIYDPCSTNERYFTPEEFNQCRKKAALKDQTCYGLYGQPVKISDESFLLYTRMCEFPLSLPADNQTLVFTPDSSPSPYYNQSPVASLYCNLFSLFGAKC